MYDLQVGDVGRAVLALQARQKELQYDTEKEGLTAEEKQLLEVQRAQMERAVSDQVRRAGEGCTHGGEGGRREGHLSDKGRECST